MILKGFSAGFYVLLFMMFCKRDKTNTKGIRRGGEAQKTEHVHILARGAGAGKGEAGAAACRPAWAAHPLSQHLVEPEPCLVAAD